MSGANMKMVGAGLATLLAAALVITAAVRSSSEPPPALGAETGTDTVSQGVDPLLELRTKGSSEAPLTIFELSDFQCPFCRQFWAETYPALIEEYIETGKVRFIFINLPLASIHPNAPAAHEVAMCAAEQERFWEMHDLLFEYQAEWGPMDDPGPFLVGLADSVGVDRSMLDQCLEEGRVRSVIAGDVNQARMARVTSTPTFIIEGGILPGAAGMDIFRPILDSMLVDKGAAN